MKSFYRTLLVAVLALVGAGVQAQSLTTAAVNGSVASTTGEPLAGATVRIVHVPSGTAAGAVANAQGRFSIQGLRTGGPYTVTVDYVGYQKYEAGNIFLSLGTDKALPIVMKEEGVALGTVEIAARRDLVINSGRTGANTVISSQQLQTMPTLNRDINSMLRFTPQSNGGNGFAGRSSALNNFTLDGAMINNNFGLGGNTLPGEAVSANPLSLDAVDEISINVAPYDVRQFGFTGGAINAVTRRGNNEFQGSIAWFGQRGNWSRAQVAGVPITLAFSERDQFVARFGGPIIKDKLFFHITAERTVREIPGFSRRAFEAGEAADATTISNVSADSLRLVSNAVRSRFGYDVGDFGFVPRFTKSTNLTASIDWNINDNHRFSVRYNWFDAADDNPPNGSNTVGVSGAAPILAASFSASRSGGASSIPFRSAYYTVSENTQSVSLELNSTLWGGKASNQLLVTGSFFWTPQIGTNQDQDFPMVEIFNQSAAGQNATTFGSELFRQGNSIQQNQYLIQNNFSYNIGKHTITLGGQFERYSFRNRFQRSRWGLWRFRSFDAFIRNIQTPDGSPIAASASPSQVVVGFDFEGRNSDAFVDAYRFGFYLQDKWTPYEGLSISGGVRIDVPGHLTDPILNAQADTLGIRTDRLPEPYVAVSPRLGINWDVFKDGRLQIRGGTGVFIGTLPFVWMTNNVSNTGLNQGGVILTSLDGSANNPGGIGGTGAGTANISINGATFSQINVDAFRRFSPNVPPTQLYPTPRVAGPASGLELNYADPNFRYPSVWRSSFAVDYSFAEDWVATIDYAYTQDIEAFYFVNEIYRADRVSGGRLGQAAGGAPVIDRIGTSITSTAPNDPAKVARGFGNIVKFTSESHGWTGFLTLQLQKRMSNNWSAMAAYTYTAGEALTDGSGSQALSTLNANPINPSFTPNAPILGPSGSVVPHRFIAMGEYQWKQSKFTRTTFSVFYQLQSGSRFSYRYDGDVNGDGVPNNDLIFIPQAQSDIFLVPGSGNAGTANQQWAQLNAFINQDPYLASRRGQWSERNGGMFPSIGRFDVGIRQDFMWEVLGKQNMLQISLDVINFGNFLNENWGVQRSLNVNATLPLTFNGFNGPGNIATFTMRQVASANNIPLDQTFILNPNTFGSRFSIQFGVRYIWGR